MFCWETGSNTVIIQLSLHNEALSVDSDHLKRYTLRLIYIWVQVTTRSIRAGSWRTALKRGGTRSCGTTVKTSGLMPPRSR